MDTIRLLDNYRLALTSDKLPLQILSRLYYNGPTEERELTSDLDADSKEIRRKVTQLFQSGFIECKESKFWIVTPFAETVLTRFGITELTAKSLLDDFDLSEDHKSFLKGCLELQSHTRSESSKYFASALRSYSISKLLVKSKAHRKHWPSDLLNVYTIIVGLDPESRRIDGKKYCDEVFLWHSYRNTEWWKEEGLRIEKLRNVIVDNCISAVEEATYSDWILRSLSKQREFDTQEESRGSENSIFITLVRILTAVVGGIVDPGLHSAYRLNHKLPDIIWDRFEKWLPGIESKAENKLRLYLFDLPHSEEVALQKRDIGRIRAKLRVTLEEDWDRDRLNFVYSSIQRFDESRLEYEPATKLVETRDSANRKAGWRFKIAPLFSRIVRFLTMKTGI